jgi:hypothetical protein
MQGMRLSQGTLISSSSRRISCFLRPHPQSESSRKRRSHTLLAALPGISSFADRWGLTTNLEMPGRTSLPGQGRWLSMHFPESGARNEYDRLPGKQNRNGSPNRSIASRRTARRAAACTHCPSSAWPHPPGASGRRCVVLLAAPTWPGRTGCGPKAASGHPFAAFQRLGRFGGA